MISKYNHAEENLCEKDNNDTAVRNNELMAYLQFGSCLTQDCGNAVNCLHFGKSQ